MSKKAFEAFTVAGVKFLAIPVDNGWSVIDEEGNAYGSWFDADSFKRHIKADKATVIGKVYRINFYMN